MTAHLKKLMVILITISNLSNSQPVNPIIFPDINLYNALCKYYEREGYFTKTDASKLSNTHFHKIDLGYDKITLLEGLQYFDNASVIELYGNNLMNLKPLTKLNHVFSLDISSNATKGNKFESSLKSMGKMNNLNIITMEDNELNSAEFLNKIGDLNHYTWILLENNNISDVSIFQNMKMLCKLDLENNRIKDVTPLKNVKNKKIDIYLKDNCIIDYKPVKKIFDRMYEDYKNDDEDGMRRYDFYTNPVNFTFDRKKIQFPYLTVYYKYQAYAEAIPLFKAFGGSAAYDKNTGVLICKYKKNELIFEDFSKKYTFNGKEKSLKYPMRRMQYDLAYLPVKDICKALGLRYNIVEKRKFYVTDYEAEYAPKLVKISSNNKN